MIRITKQNKPRLKKLMVQFLNNISFVEVGFWIFVIAGVLHGVGVIFGGDEKNETPKEEKKEQ